MNLLEIAIRVYEIILLIRIVFSWIRPSQQSQFVQWIYKLTDPVLQPISRMLPTNRFGFDFSPVIVFFLLQIVRRLLFLA